MSLINQVLSDLEKRGEAVAGTEAVHAESRSAAHWWLSLLLVAILLSVGLLPLMGREPVPPTAPSAHQTTRPAASPAIQAASAVAEAATTEETESPSLRLSFELSSIPLLVSEPASRGAVAARNKPAAEKGKMQAAAEVQQELPVKRISPQQQAVDEYNQALALIQQGSKGEALPHLEATLRLDPDNVEARLTLAGLLLESKLNAEAERTLQDGLRHDPRQPQLAMLLARLQVERGTTAQALATLETTLPFADRRADYHAFFAAVLQRLGRHKEAINHYQIALRMAPDSAIWWMGLGISLQAVEANEAARDAFRHAADMHKLAPELQAFVEKQIKGVAAPK